MDLVSLKPKWMRKNGVAVAMIFMCPRCVVGKCVSKKVTWLTCMFDNVPHSEQRVLIQRAIDDSPNDFNGVRENDVVGCVEKVVWKRNCKVFERISITPSLHAGLAGHWHGHITDGKIIGGLK